MAASERLTISVEASKLVVNAKRKYSIKEVIMNSRVRKFHKPSMNFISFSFFITCISLPIKERWACDHFLAANHPPMCPHLLLWPYCHPADCDLAMQGPASKVCAFIFSL